MAVSRQPQRVLVGIGGGIAAYKVCEIISALVKSGVEVRAILTEAAQQFISPLTIATLCRHRVYTDRDFWTASQGRPLHIDLGEWATVILIAPLTANTLGKLAYGLADNLLTNTILASSCPVLLAPAMNTTMWGQGSVQDNWQQLREQPRYHGLGPAAGVLACDTIGPGRMAEPPEILAYLISLFHTQGHRDLADTQILISAGSTREHFDPVRFIGNPATGKMGLALAQAALHRGAAVRLVHGPVAWVPPLGVPAIAVTSAEQMRQAMLQYFPAADWTVMAAAVADVRPADPVAEKLPKQSLPPALPLQPVPDILTELAHQKQPHQKLIGFAAQTGDLLAPARQKLETKKLDAIAANPIDQPGSGFGSDTNQAIFLDSQGRQVQIPPTSKLLLAHRLYDFVQSIEKPPGDTPDGYG